MPASSRTDNPALAGLMLGLGAFLSSYVNQRMIMKEFNFDVEKLEEAKRRSNNQLEIDRRQIMLRERSNDLKESGQQLERDLPALRETARLDFFDRNLENQIKAKQQLGEVEQNLLKSNDERKFQTIRKQQQFDAQQAPPPAPTPAPQGSSAIDSGLGGQESFDEASGRMLKELRDRFPGSFKKTQPDTTKAKTKSEKQEKPKEVSKEFEAFRKTLSGDAP